jgi:glycosyltransferase involved in cell wall biosynthesis
MYNHARFVRECLDSLLTEGWPNLEVLLLDDGSSDGSFEVAQQWRWEHPGAFSRFELGRQANQGVTRTLNKLVAQSRGEYLTLVASDDALLPGGLAKRIEVLNQHLHWLAVLGNAWIMDLSGQVFHRDGARGFKQRASWVLDHPDTLCRELLIRWWVPGPTLLLRRRAFDPDLGVGLYDESIAYEDRDFYLRLLQRTALGFVDYPVALYRVDMARLGALPSERFMRDEVRSELKHLGGFSGFERLGLWTRANRTLAKLALRTAPGSRTAKLRLGVFQVMWAGVQLYHQLYLRFRGLWLRYG